MKQPTLRGKLAIGAASVFVAIASALAWSTPASAHDVDRSGPSFCGPAHLLLCGYGGVYSNHTWVYACDSMADGYGFAIQYVLESGSGGLVADANGSSAGCGSRKVGTASNQVDYFQLCNTTLHVCTT